MDACYRYRAALVRVIDGDTYVLEVDLGFRVSTTLEVRLRGVDTPELPTQEGASARAFALSALSGAQKIVIESVKDKRSFARWVADVYVDGEHLGGLLRAAGHGAVARP